MTDSLEKRFASLPEEIQPDRDLWPGISAQLQAPVSHARPHRQWPLALAAGIALVAVTAAITWRIATPPGVAPERVLASLVQTDSAGQFSPGSEFLSTRAELVSALQENWSRLPPDSQRIVADNLLEIRRSLNAIEAALTQDPNNASLQQLLHTTYEQELQLLVTLNRVSQTFPVEVEI